MDETVENEMVQDDAAMDADKGENTGYYKSQEEVDRAFKKRLERERRKWEQSLKEQKADPIEKERQEVDPVNEELTKIAGELEPFLTKIVNEGDLGLETEQEPDRETEDFVDAVLKEVEALEAEYTDVDLTEDLKNPLFMNMLKEGQPLKKVYDYFNPERNREALYREIERDVTERIRARNSKPDSIAYANASNAAYDISRLSQRDIEDIDRRVKRGERVVL